MPGPFHFQGASRPARPSERRDGPLPPPWRSARHRSQRWPVVILSRAPRPQEACKGRIEKCPTAQSRLVGIGVRLYACRSSGRHDDVIHNSTNLSQASAAQGIAGCSHRPRTTRGSSVVEQAAHNRQVAGAIPAPASRNNPRELEVGRLSRRQAMTQSRRIRFIGKRAGRASPKFFTAFLFGKSCARAHSARLLPRARFYSGGRHDPTGNAIRV